MPVPDDTEDDAVSSPVSPGYAPGDSAVPASATLGPALPGPAAACVALGADAAPAAGTPAAGTPAAGTAGVPSWSARDAADDFYDELWADEFDPDCSPPEDWAEWLAAVTEDDGGDVPPRRAAESMAAGFTHRVAGDLPGRGFAGGGVLDGLAPGPVLAGFTADAVFPAGGPAFAGLSDDELVGVLCAARRMASWSAAGETGAVLELANRRKARAKADEAAGRREHHLAEHVAEELAAALTLTGRSADRLLDVALRLERLAKVRAALAAGAIDWPRAVIFADELAGVPGGAAADIEARVLPAAAGMTTAQLRRALRAAVLKADPAGRERRQKAGRKESRVEVWEEGSGNAALAGRELAPGEVIAADARITALARWLQGQGAEGTLDTLRGKVFTAVLSGRPVTTLLPGPATGAAPGTTAATGGPGTGTSGAGAPAAGGTRTPAGSQTPARTGATGTATAAAAGTGTPAGTGRPGSTGTGAEVPGVDVPLIPAGLAGTINLTMPLSAWQHLSQAPGEVAGYGPADAGTCRELAAGLARGPGTRWCVTLTGPDGRAAAHACARRRDGPAPPGGDITGWLGRLKIRYLAAGTCDHRHQTPGYRPSNLLAHLIRTRQRTCCYPGCSRPAQRCDYEHTLPWNQGGITCECNGAPVCRRHHQAKQSPDWHLEQPAPGHMTWNLPHGRKYDTTPEPYPV